jgi:hypothetical protein
LIYLPDKKFVICIDSLSAGATPFMGLDLTMNMHEYLKIFDTLLALDFDVMVPGHHSSPATKEDVRIAKDYVMDVYNTVSRILGEDHRALTARASRKYTDNSWAISSVVIDDEVNQCANEIKRFGRKPKLTPQQIDHARKLLDKGEARKYVADLLNVGRSTLYRALNS